MGRASGDTNNGKIKLENYISLGKYESQGFEYMLLL